MRNAVYLRGGLLYDDPVSYLFKLVFGEHFVERDFSVRLDFLESVVVRTSIAARPRL